MSQTKAQLLDPKGDVTYSGHITGVGATFNGNITAVDGIFSGNVSVAGTLTKQDVTNVDSIGIITARDGIDSPTNLVLRTGGTERFRIDSAGRLLVGTDTDASESTVTLEGNSGSNTGYSVLDLRRGEAADAEGDVLGYIRFSDTNITSGNQNYAHIHAAVDGASTNASDNPGRLVFSTTADGDPGPTERLRITSDGKVGVGVNPTNYPGKFVVSGDALICDRDIHSRVANSVANSDRGFKQDIDGTEKLHLYADNSSNIILEGNGGSERLRIASTGSVGIGTTVPQYKLHVDGTIINSKNVNSTGDAGIQIANSHRLGFDQSGTRSWTVKATGGNLEVQSGDGNGSLKSATNGGVHDNKGNVRSVPLNTQGSAYTLVANDAGKAILAGNNVTFNTSVMSAGDMVTIINNTNGNISIVAGAGTALYNTADAATGTRTLATRGMATIYFTHNTTGYISGSGLS